MTSSDHYAQQQSADLAEFRANVERAEGAQLNFITTRTSIGRAVLDLAAPAEQASKQVPTIDTAEFGELLAHYALVVDASGGTEQEWKEARAELIAHIDAKLAGQPAAPVAATEQAKDTPESMANSNARFAIDGAIQYGRENRNQPPSKEHWLYEYWNIGRQLNEAGRTGRDNITPLATPADAGAGLTDEQITEVVRRSVAAGETIWAGFKKDSEGRYTIPDLSPMEFKLARLIEREVRARLSTSTAPVTASQPAAQVPSIDRDAVLEEAAKACELQNDTEWPTPLGCAHAIRALKDHPAAAHAAKSEEQDIWIAFNSADDDEAVMFFTEMPGHEFKDRFHLKHFKCRLVAAAHAAHDQKGGDA